MGESRATPVSCSGVDGGNSLQEDVQFKVLHRFYPSIQPNKATTGLFIWGSGNPGA